jgi:hypothetical protein
MEEERTNRSWVAAPRVVRALWKALGPEVGPKVGCHFLFDFFLYFVLVKEI